MNLNFNGNKNIVICTAYAFAIIMDFFFPLLFASPVK